MVNFHEQRAIKHDAIWTNINLKTDNMVLNNMTKFYKILIKTIQLGEPTSFQTVIFHKQMAITLESMVQYGPLSK